MLVAGAVTVVVALSSYHTPANRVNSCHQHCFAISALWVDLFAAMYAMYRTPASVQAVSSGLSSSTSSIAAWHVIVIVEDMLPRNVTGRVTTMRDEGVAISFWYVLTSMSATSAATASGEVDMRRTGSVFVSTHCHHLHLRHETIPLSDGFVTIVRLMPIPAPVSPRRPANGLALDRATVYSLI